MKSGAEPWAEPLVRRLMQKHGGKDPERIIEGYAAQLLAQAGEDRLPVNVDGIASLQGIRTQVRDYDFVGRIYAEESGQLVMDLNAGDPEPRRRFTAAHELIHTAFPGFKKDARYRVDDVTGTHQRHRAQEEYLCDLGAAALLMPRHLVVGHYSARGGLQVVEGLAADAEVSLEAAGNRLISISDLPALFMVLEVMYKPAELRALRKDETLTPRLRVRYATSSQSQAFIPRYKSADERSVMVRALKATGVVRGVETLPGQDGGPAFVVEAKAYPRRRDQQEVERVLALAVADESSIATKRD